MYGILTGVTANTMSEFPRQFQNIKNCTEGTHFLPVLYIIAFYMVSAKNIPLEEFIWNGGTHVCHRLNTRYTNT